MEILFILIGMFLGSGIGLLLYKKLYTGVLHIDRSDPTDAPYIFLELQKSLPSLHFCKFIILKVNEENFIPRK